MEPDPFWNALASLCRPRDSRTIVEWAAEFVKSPNSARSQSGFDPAITPWLVDPINAHSDASLRLIYCSMPTGGGKTQLHDCCIPYEIAEMGVSNLLGVQGNNEAKIYVQSRLLPMLKKIPHIADLFALMSRHHIKKDAIIFQHANLFMGGINETNAQAKSVDRVKLDEFWQAYHGAGAEFEARMHDRPLRLMTITSQGGVETIPGEEGPITSEHEAYWRMTDQQDFSWKCPECGGVQRFRMRGSDPRGYALRYDRGARDGEIDELAVKQSARLCCIDRCGLEFQDTPQNRFTLSSSARYVPANPAASPEFRGYHVHALGLHYVPWWDTALRHAKAMHALKRGDSVPMRIFRQKRCAENVREVEAVPQTALTIGMIGEGDEAREYKFEDYANGQLWGGETVRIMTIDIQKDHFWAVIQAWKPDGSARLLFADKVSTEDGLREIQVRFGVQPLARTQPGTRFQSWVFVDSSYDQDRAWNMGGKYGWWSIRGDGNRIQYPHAEWVGKKQVTVYRFFSKFDWVAGTKRILCRTFHWTNLPIKRILEKMRGGYREPWEVPADLPPKYQEHLFSEIEKDTVSKVTKKRSRAFVPIGGRPNHLWDCCAMQVVGALIANCLADQPEPPASTADAPEHSVAPTLV